MSGGGRAVLTPSLPAPGALIHPQEERRPTPPLPVCLLRVSESQRPGSPQLGGPWGLGLTRLLQWRQATGRRKLLSAKVCTKPILPSTSALNLRK